MSEMSYEKLVTEASELDETDRRIAVDEAVADFFARENEEPRKKRFLARLDAYYARIVLDQEKLKARHPMTEENINLKQLVDLRTKLNDADVKHARLIAEHRKAIDHIKALASDLEEALDVLDDSYYDDTHLRECVHDLRRRFLKGEPDAAK
jgi:hypothetical protein